MALTTGVNLVLNAQFEPHASWALLPVAVFSFGWSLMAPAVTLLVPALVILKLALVWLVVPLLM